MIEGKMKPQLQNLDTNKGTKKWVKVSILGRPYHHLGKTFNYCKFQSFLTNVGYFFDAQNIPPKQGI